MADFFFMLVSMWIDTLFLAPSEYLSLVPPYSIFLLVFIIFRSQAVLL
jgi:hypothetical protein